MLHRSLSLHTKVVVEVQWSIPEAYEYHMPQSILNEFMLAKRGH